MKLIWHAAPPSPLPACRVYKIAKETPLQEAKQLSKQTGNSIFLKREDLQVGDWCVVAGLAGCRAACLQDGLGWGAPRDRWGAL